MINQSLYPITAAAAAQIYQDGAEPADLTVDRMLEQLGEYEHGSVDIADVASGMTLEMYAAVVVDLGLGLMHGR
jgi:hypothetical protein